jgi:hypothetical protein
MFKFSLGSSEYITKLGEDDNIVVVMLPGVVENLHILNAVFGSMYLFGIIQDDGKNKVCFC